MTVAAADWKVVRRPIWISPPSRTAVRNNFGGLTGKGFAAAESSQAAQNRLMTTQTNQADCNMYTKLAFADLFKTGLHRPSYIEKNTVRQVDADKHLQRVSRPWDQTSLR